MYTYLKNGNQYEIYTEKGIQYCIKEEDLVFHKTEKISFSGGEFIGVSREEAIIVLCNYWDDVTAHLKGRKTKGVLYD